MILEAMYNGEFYPCETVVPTSPEYRKAVIACEKLMEQLSQRLSKEDYELVQELRAQTAIASRFIHTLVIKFTTIKSVIALILWGDA